MDTDKLISASRARFEHTAAKKILREKYEGKMIFGHAGGMWRAGPELHMTITACGRQGQIVLPDLYGTPTQVDSQTLLGLSQERWHEQMNAWHVEYTELNNKR